MIKKEVEEKPVFSVRHPNGKELKDIFGAIPKELGDIDLEVFKDDVRIEKLDAAHVFLTELNIKKEAFELWSVEREGKINVALSALLKTLSCAGAEPVELKFDDDGLHSLLVRYPESERKFWLKISESVKHSWKKPKL